MKFTSFLFVGTPQTLKVGKHGLEFFALGLAPDKIKKGDKKLIIENKYEK